jgi:hypothetical protein
MEIKSDKNGYPYFDQLPEEYRIATIDDFHKNGKLNIGMKFLIRWIDNENYYEVREVKENLTGKYLKPHIDDNRVFVEKKENENL